MDSSLPDDWHSRLISRPKAMKLHLRIDYWMRKFPTSNDPAAITARIQDLTLRRNAEINAEGDAAITSQ